MPRDEPAPILGDRASEAAKAVARARAAAAARLRDAARAGAQKSPVAVPVEKSGAAGQKRRAKPDLQEQPPVAGEVEVARRAPPSLHPGQVVVSPEAVVPLTPLHAEMLTPPVTRSRPSPSPPDAVTPLARDPTTPLPIAEHERSAPPQGPTQPLSIDHRGPSGFPIDRPPQPPGGGVAFSESPTAENGGVSASAPRMVSRPVQSLFTVVAPAGSAGSPVPGVVPSQSHSDRITVKSAYDPEKERKTELVEVLPPRPEEEPARPPVRALWLVSALAGASLLSAVLVPQFWHRRSPPAVVTPDAEDPALLLGRIDRAMDVEDWPAATRLINDGLKALPQSSGLLDRSRRAEAEQRNQLRYDAFRGAAQRHNDETALALFAEIPGESLYKGKASVQAQHVRDALISGKLADARAARRMGMCKEVRRLAQAILAIDHGNDVALRACCTSATADEVRSLEARCTSERRGPQREERNEHGLRNPFPRSR